MAKSRKKASDDEVLAELSKQAKVRITTMIDLDLYEELKVRAVKDGDGRYQTFLNSLLRSVLFVSAEKDQTSALFEKILDAQESISKRMDKVNKTVGEVVARVDALEPASAAKKGKAGKKKSNDAA